MGGNLKTLVLFLQVSYSSKDTLYSPLIPTRGKSPRFAKPLTPSTCYPLGTLLAE